MLIDGSSHEEIRKWKERKIWLRSHLVHTSQRKVAEMLELARAIIARAARQLPFAQRLPRVDVVAVRQGSEAAGNGLKVVWVPAEGPKAGEGTLVGRVVRRRLGGRLCFLCSSAWPWMEIVILPQLRLRPPCW